MNKATQSSGRLNKLYDGLFRKKKYKWLINMKKYSNSEGIRENES